jgi:hypothetical protein
MKIKQTKEDQNKILNLEMKSLKRVKQIFTTIFETWPLESEKFFKYINEFQIRVMSFGLEVDYQSPGKKIIV